MRNRSLDVLSYLFLFLGALLYCQRFLGSFCLETDMLANVSYRLNENLLRLDHNPYQWDYSSWMPFIGLNNPIILLLTSLVKVFAPKLSEVGQAYFINWGVSCVLLTLFTWTVFGFLRYCGRTRGAALFGAIVAGFTGFHLTGVRLFNHMYLLSSIAVCPTLLCFFKITQSKRPIKYVLLGSLCIGLSFLGGTNAPLFYYLPFFFFIPVFQAYKRHQLSAVLEVWKWMLLSCVLALLVGAATVLPGLYYLEDTNRIYIKFVSSEYVLSLFEQLKSLLLRDWWWKRSTGYYESDCFLGLPALLLCAIAVYQKGLKRERSFQSIDYVLILCLGISLVILNIHLFPHTLSASVAWIYERLSIRISARFFMLALLPLSFFAAKGFDLSAKRNYERVLMFVLVATAGVFAFGLVLEWNTLVLSKRAAAVISLSLGTLCSCVLVFRYRLPYFRRGLEVLSLGGLYFSYLYAPVPESNYVRFATVPSPVLNVKSVFSYLSFKGHYSEIIAALENYLLHPPSYLKSKESLKGRIWDPMEEAVLRTNYFASRSKHQMAFSSVYDMASSQRLRQYFQGSTQSMKDLYNICWEVLRRGDSAKLKKRSHCLPPATLLSHLEFFEDDSAVVRWLQSQETKTLSQTGAIRCHRQKCGEVPAHLFEVGKPEGATALNYAFKEEVRQPGKWDLKIHSSAAALLFISIPYRRDWVAEVNGREIPLLRINHAFMGVPIPKGVVSVHLRLDNKVVSLAQKISLASVLTLLLGLMVSELSLRFRGRNLMPFLRTLPPEGGSRLD